MNLFSRNSAVGRASLMPCPQCCDHGGFRSPAGRFPGAVAIYDPDVLDRYCCRACALREGPPLRFTMVLFCQLADQLSAKMCQLNLQLRVETLQNGIWAHGKNHCCNVFKLREVHLRMIHRRHSPSATPPFTYGCTSATYVRTFNPPPLSPTSVLSSWMIDLDGLL